MKPSDENWQSDKSLKEAILYMWTGHVGSDVIFEVGERRDRVLCHRFILEARSSVMYRLFNGPLARKVASTPIEITDAGIDADIFQLFLRYLYTDDVTSHLDHDNVLALLYLARKYDVQRLEEECSNYLKNENLFSPDSACFIYQQGYMFDMEAIKSESLAIIRQNARECLQSEYFCLLQRQCVEDIISDDNLQIEELELCRCVLTWAERECQRQLLSVNDASKRKVLGDLLYKIRFPIMPTKDFGHRFASSSLLTKAEKNAIFDYLEGIPTKDISFMHKPRNLAFPLTRMDVCVEDLDVDKEVHALEFTVSSDVNLHGIQSFGPANHSNVPNENFRVRIEIEDGTGAKLLSEDVTKAVIYNQKVYDILFSRAVPLTAETRYTVLFWFLDDVVWVWRGNEGRSELQHTSGVTMDIYPSRKSTEATDLYHGQIPGFIISRKSSC